MASPKVYGWLTAIALMLVVLGAGSTYLFLTLRDRGVERDFTQVRSLLNQKDYERASLVLDQRLEKGRGGESWYPEALALRLELQRADGDDAGARETASLLLEPDRKYKGEARLKAHEFLGLEAIESGDGASAEKHFDAILAEAGAKGAAADLARLGKIRIRLATQGATPEIAQELKALLASSPDSPYREDVEFALGSVNLKLLYSPVPMEGDEIYAIEKGDSIHTIAKKFKIPQDLLLSVNGILDARRLSIGRRIKVPKVDFSIEVDKSSNTLTLLNHGEFFKRYRVRTGKVDYLTPAGAFQVINKKKDPQWTDPKSGRTYLPNDPENELGTRWIGFQGASLGIHGTIHPETIGTYASNGCVGMIKEDVEELFDLISVGTPIKITGTIQAGSQS